MQEKVYAAVHLQRKKSRLPGKSLAEFFAGRRDAFIQPCGENGQNKGERNEYGSDCGKRERRAAQKHKENADDILMYEVEGAADVAEVYADFTGKQSRQSAFAKRKAVYAEHRKRRENKGVLICAASRKSVGSAVYGDRKRKQRRRSYIDRGYDGISFLFVPHKENITRDAAEGKINKPENGENIGEPQFKILSGACREKRGEHTRK